MELFTTRLRFPNPAREAVKTLGAEPGWALGGALRFLVGARNWAPPSDLLLGAPSYQELYLNTLYPGEGIV